VIAIDSSAIIAIILDEPEADACIAALETEDSVLISAGTVAETLIVGARRGVGEEVARLIDGLALQIVPVTPAAARQIAQAYAEWGKGVHPALLNFGDCFAYAVAKEHGCRLLYVGDDFAKTDLEGVLPPRSV
jgi:ribonuclease VapC